MADGADDIALSETAAAKAFAPDDVVARLGARVRAARTAKGMTRNALAAASGVSIRYLAQIETGRGNTSVALLAKVAAALETKIEALVQETPTPSFDDADIAALWAAAPPEARDAARAALTAPAPGRARRVALIGLRGAGKSTLGARLAAAFDAPFVELNQEIQAQSGMPVADLIALYGPDEYRRMEAEAIRRTARSRERVVLAVAGGVVGGDTAFETLLTSFHAIWLRAAPEEHMARVRAQGDHRPMAGNPAAMDQLRALLASREPLYARASFAVDTSGVDIEAAFAALRALVVEEGLLAN